MVTGCIRAKPDTFQTQINNLNTKSQLKSTFSSSKGEIKWRQAELGQEAIYRHRATLGGRARAGNNQIS